VSGTASTGPIAIAGSDTTIAYPSSTAMLNGSQSYSPDGTIVSYVWNQVSGPSNAAITTDSGATSMVSQLTLGVYVFQLKVTDNLGNVSTSTVTVTVMSTERTSKDQFSIYPNPVVGGTITVNGINNYTGPVMVTLHDMRGRIIMNYEFDKSGNEVQQTIPLPANLARGVYVLSIHFEGQTVPYVYEIVKQ
jgi:hypothetical protein